VQDPSVLTRVFGTTQRVADNIEVLAFIGEFLGRRDEGERRAMVR
jgi:hypothetical protein